MSIIEEKYSRYVVTPDEFRERHHLFEEIANIDNPFENVEERMQIAFSKNLNESIPPCTYTINTIDAIGVLFHIQILFTWVMLRVTLESIRKAALDYYTWDDCGPTANHCLITAQALRQDGVKTRLGFMTRRETVMRRFVNDIVLFNNKKFTLERFTYLTKPFRPILDDCFNVMVEIDFKVKNMPFLIQEDVFYYYLLPQIIQQKKNTSEHK